MLTIRLGTNYPAGSLRELEDLRLWPSIIVNNKTWINIAHPKEHYITTMRVYSPTWEPEEC